MLDIILIIVSTICLIVGLLLLRATDKVQFSTARLLIWLLVVIVVQVLEHFSPMLGSKYSGLVVYPRF